MAIKLSKTDWLAIALVLLGCSKAVFDLAGLHLLAQSAQALGIAVSPGPFRQPRRGEGGGILRCDFSDGEKRWVRFDRAFRNRIGGTHRRGVFYLNLLEPLSFTDRRKLVLEEALRRGFCPMDGALREPAGCEGKISGVHYEVRSIDGSAIAGTEVECR